jgi:hypothetical protein
MDIQTNNTSIGNIPLFKKEYGIVISNKIQSEKESNNVSISDDSSIISILQSSSDENSINALRLNILEKQFSDNLISLIKEEPFEYGYDNQTDIFVRKLMDENRVVTKEWLNNIFNRNFGNSNIIIGILRLIARFSHSDIAPQGQTMATAALIHKNFEVQECAIRAFESWASLESLEILKNINVHIDWLKDYLESVIRDIEMKYGIFSQKN